MKKVLYITNIEVPYRVTFLNKLSKNVDLTVLYERKKSSNRDEKWSNSIKSSFKALYLNGVKVNNEYTISLGILKYIFSKEFDEIIIGCYNSPSQILAILFMRLFRKKYILNLDGEYFLDGNSFKKKIKRFLIYGARKYLIAGEKANKNLSKFIPADRIQTYYFSSLTEEEIKINSEKVNQNNNNSILVVGQYFDYKGLDIALECAKMNENYKYKFIGSGNRSKLLNEKVSEMKLSNVEIIPFLQKEELYLEYQNCRLLVLPSRQECWGLVLNEAASFGCPIVSTYGCGAANEFLTDKFLAEPNNSSDLYGKIKECINNKKIDDYKAALIRKSREYTIEKSVEKTLEIIL